MSPGRPRAAWGPAPWCSGRCVLGALFLIELGIQAEGLVQMAWGGGGGRPSHPCCTAWPLGRSGPSATVGVWQGISQLGMWGPWGRRKGRCHAS